MKKLTLTFFAILLTFSTFGQINIDNLERVDGLWTKKGEKTSYTGQFIEYFENGKIKGKGEFKDGVVNGLRIVYYENGNKSLERNYYSGIIDGLSIEYYPSGKVKQEANFKNGKEDGTPLRKVSDFEDV